MLGEIVEERKVFPWHSSQVVELVGSSSHLYLDSRLEKSFTVCVLYFLYSLYLFFCWDIKRMEAGPKVLVSNDFDEICAHLCL